MLLIAIPVAVGIFCLLNLILLFVVSRYLHHIVAMLKEELGDFSELLILVKKLQPSGSTPSPVVGASFNLNGAKWSSTMNLADNGSLTASIALDDALGNAVPGAAPDASPAPAWSLSNSALGSLVPSADGLSAVFTPNGTLGSTQILFSCSVNGVAINATSPAVNVVPGPVTQAVMSLATN